MGTGIQGGTNKYKGQSSKWHIIEKKNPVLYAAGIDKLSIDMRNALLGIGTTNQRVGLYWLFIVLTVGGNRWQLTTKVS